MKPKLKPTVYYYMGKWYIIKGVVLGPNLFDNNTYVLCRSQKSLWQDAWLSAKCLPAFGQVEYETRDEAEQYAAKMIEDERAEAWKLERASWRTR